MTARPIRVEPWAMQLCDGNARDAMVLSQLAWRIQPRDTGARRTHHLVMKKGPDGELVEWMWTTDTALAEELTMSGEQVRGARLSLAKRGAIAARSSMVDGVKRTLIRLTLPEHLTRTSPEADSEPDSGIRFGQGDGLDSVTSTGGFREVPETHAGAVPCREKMDEEGPASTSEAAASSSAGSSLPREEPPSANGKDPRKALAQELTQFWYDARVAETGSSPGQDWLKVRSAILGALTRPHPVPEHRLRVVLPRLSVVSGPGIDIEIGDELKRRGQGTRPARRMTPEEEDEQLLYDLNNPPHGPDSVPEMPTSGPIYDEAVRRGMISA